MGNNCHDNGIRRVARRVFIIMEDGSEKEVTEGAVKVGVDLFSGDTTPLRALLIGAKSQNGEVVGIRCVEETTTRSTGKTVSDNVYLKTIR